MNLQRHVPLFVLCLFGLRVLACGDDHRTDDMTGGSSGGPDASVTTDASTGGGGGTGPTTGGGSDTTAGGTGGAGTGGINTGGGNPTGGAAGTGGNTEGWPEPPKCEWEERDGGGRAVLTYHARLASGATELRRHDCDGVCQFDPNIPWPSCGLPIGAPPYQLCLSVADCANISYCQSYGAPSRILLGSASCVESVCEWKAKTTEPCPGNTTCTGKTCGGTAGTTSGGFPWGTGGSGGQGGAPNHD